MAINDAAKYTETYLGLGPLEIVAVSSRPVSTPYKEDPMKEVRYLWPARGIPKNGVTDLIPPEKDAIDLLVDTLYMNGVPVGAIKAEDANGFAEGKISRLELNQKHKLSAQMFGKLEDYKAKHRIPIKGDYAIIYRKNTPEPQVPEQPKLL